MAFCFRGVGLWSLLSLLSTVTYRLEHHEAGHGKPQKKKAAHLMVEGGTKVEEVSGEHMYQP